MSEVNHTDREHSPIGASSSKRWFECPASIPLSENVEQTTSAYAEEGTAAHELAEYCLVEDLDACHGLGLEFNGYVVTQEMAEAVQVYLDAVRERITDQCDVLVEDKFHLHWIDEECFGSNDCCIIDHEKGRITVLDYKHGQGVAVEAENNTQLLYYALGAFNGFNQIYEVHLVIVQPRCPHEKGPVRVWETNIDELERYEEELKERVTKVREVQKIARDEPPKVYDYAKAGDHCHFCPANGFCHKLRDKSYEVAEVHFADETIEPLAPELMTAEEISKVLTHAKTLEGWIKAVRSYAHNAVENGESVPGMKLVKKRGHRKWTNEKEAIDTLDMLLTEKEMYTKKLISPAQAEKIVGKETIDKLTTKPETGTQLVPETDKRPAVTPAVELLEIDI
jgi:hypothetical protein